MSFMSNDAPEARVAIYLIGMGDFTAFGTAA